jgi:hypothetical protein
LGIVDSRGVAKLPRWLSIIATVAVVCLASALLGSWAVGPNTVASHELTAAAQGAAATAGDMTRPAAHFAHPGPSSENQKSFKTAGIKRDRPPTWLRSAPAGWWLTTPSTLNTSGCQAVVPPSGVFVRTLAAQDLLNRIGVARC